MIFIHQQLFYKTFEFSNVIFDLSTKYWDLEAFSQTILPANFVIYETGDIIHQSGVLTFRVKSQCSLLSNTSNN